MNRIVREHYPVSKLPEDLQAEFVGADTVRLVVEEVHDPLRDSPDMHSYEKMMEGIKPMSLKEMLADRAAHPEKYRGNVTPEEAVARIRELRDEWDSDR